MADIFSKKKRSMIMASVKSSNTKPELKVKKAIRGLGFSYQPEMKGNPDFISRKRKVAIFVNGCFWHKCKTCYRPPSANKHYWESKIETNKIRDGKNARYLRGKGYRVITIWEHQLKKGGKLASRQALIKSIKGCQSII